MERPRPSRPTPDAPARPGTRRLNLGVLAHVDAGKTSLTEALLHAGGAIDRIGGVDAGTTQTDTLALERQRGITIRSAVASFRVGDIGVNLVDTPGHPDFIAEVDRSLAVLDGAVLVLSAVEGVQAQTVVLYRALRRLEVPLVLFVNKIDRSGAAPERVLDEIRYRLNPAAVPLNRALGAGAPVARAQPLAWSEPAVAEDLTAQLASHDDGLLAEWLAGPVRARRLRSSLERSTRAGAVHPVLFGSARTGAGLTQLIDTVTRLLTPPAGDETAAVSAQVFKVERPTSGGRHATLRMRSGVLRLRDRVPLGGGRTATVTGLEVFEPGGPVRRARAAPGQIARVRGLDTVQIGDWLGSEPASCAAADLPRPGFETRVVARDPAEQEGLRRALTELADIDPLIAIRPDRGAVRISTYGEVQQQVLAQTLAAEFGIDADFRGTTVACVERPSRTGAAVRRMGDPGHLLNYTLAVRIEPAPPGSGIDLAVEAPRTGVPLHVYSTLEGYRSAMLGYLTDPLASGPHGWPVTDVRVIVTESNYPPAGPRASEVRHTTGEVVREAVQRAGTTVCEPVDHFTVEAPAQTLAAVLGLLARHGATMDGMDATDERNRLAVVSGTIRTAAVGAVRAGLNAATNGQGVLECDPDHFAPR
ncbi:TetM/TetW/TetO/TetS family tetracycline resistance ribosomal protection protein [Occultella glacieicola]|uniref:TetM/TetW/TetO/TetS family tetracycline resistance ribosomal protection protein n=1 Tax=Occultella glacieicola TaxID=2518684 RepID=A0ABY2E0E6_9MICO|nr:TetM/TetW/TetO/TetS family tetracycline resistance ribosomal protection protein [Occultella glacieicola]TDE90894.1 TetM/TetW/TetO/TetS family tetracycline resistance ribosomal protection protein [Occultella glacieicola]